MSETRKPPAHAILQPAGWRKPKGYANGIAAEGKLVFVGGQIGWTGQSRFECHDLVGQVRQTLHNVLAVLAEAGAAPQHIVRMTWYVRDMDEYLAVRNELGPIYRDIIGRHFPAMALVEVRRLVEPGARLEIEATAVVPEA